MAWLWWVLIGFLAVVLVAGVVSALAERRGWIKNERTRRLLRKLYGLDR